MGKASSSKKVARAARTGGGRTRRGASSLFWPVFIGIVVVLGTAGIVYSRDQRQVDTSAPRPAHNGKPGDHWHAALGFDICGEFAPNINDQADTVGIHTHGDGVVHIHPFSDVAAGSRATLGVFFKTVKASVSSSEIQLPGQPGKSNGDKCGDKPGKVQVMTWPSKAPDAKGVPYTGNPSDLRPKNGELITIAFMPEGAEIPRPASAPQLDALNDVGPSTTAPGPQTESTVPGSTPSTAPGATVPVTPPASTAPASAPPPSSSPGSSSVP